VRWKSRSFVIACMELSKYPTTDCIFAIAEATRGMFLAGMTMYDMDLEAVLAAEDYETIGDNAIPVLTIESKDSITIEVMIRTVPMPPSVLMAILSQLAHVACGISDSNTVKNDRRSVAPKHLQYLLDIIINSFTCGGPLEDFEIKDARYATPVGADEMRSHC
jgi:hypothetical protein